MTADKGSFPLPPVDPRHAVHACCGDTHWGPEPKDYPCTEREMTPEETQAFEEQWTRDALRGHEQTDANGGTP